MVLAAVSLIESGEARERGGDPRGRSRATSAAAPGYHNIVEAVEAAAAGDSVMSDDRDADRYVGTSVAAQGGRAAAHRPGHLHRQPDAAGHGLHGRRPQPVRPRAHPRRRPRRGARGRGRRRRVQRRRPAGRLEGLAALRLAGHRGHQDAAALPARGRRGALPGRRRRGRDRGEPRARRRTRPSSSRSTTSRSTRPSTSRRRSRTARRSSMPTSARTSATSGSSPPTTSTGGARRRRRHRDAALLPAAADPERDRAARRASRRPGPTGDVTLCSATQIPHILRFARRARRSASPSRRSA